MLEIWKASAGSGKTYKLTGDYLVQLLSGGTDRYKSILAVTFTNKATGEMKQRILKELNTLASGGRSSYLRELMGLERFSKVPEEGREQAVRDHAGALLSEILNDYSQFNISTIDRFFQQVLRSFAMETGHFASYNVELNDNAVLAMAVDGLMSSIDDNKELLDWLISLSIEAVENGRDWDSVPQLLRLGAELFKEPFKLAVRNTGSGLPGRDRIAACGMEMRRIVSDFRAYCKEITDEVSALMDRYGLEFGHFRGGSRSFMTYFKKLQSGKYELPSDTFVGMLEKEASKWCASSCKDKTDAVVRAYNDGLADLVKQVAGPQWRERLRKYYTAQEILRNLSSMGILSDIDEGVREYCRSNNMVLLSSTPKFLSEIIDGSDTPFVYEKVGGRIDNYLLDEFQDTSRMQWDNFRPLIADSVDRGNFCMAVGDVKQSIYRWRGSDWKLLDSGIESDLGPDRCRKDTLLYNWRSSAEVVDFNNSFFPALENLVEDNLLGGIYADAAQKVPEGVVRPQGHVRVTFIDKNTGMMDEAYLNRILEAVGKLTDNGYRPGDIAFLVRTRAEGTAISDYLISKGFSIVTEDSLKVSSSAAVRHIVDRLREMSEGVGASDEKSLYNICEELLRTGGCTEQDGGPAFLTAFLDSVVEFIGKGGSDISGFLEWWEAEGKERSVSAPEGRDAFRVITVHKSKGLEFKAVIVPFFQMDLSPRGNLTKYIWCACPDPSFNMLPVYPLEYRSSLGQTYFEKEYLEEKRLSAVDAVNVTYVAFTRAEQELLVFAQAPDSARSAASSVAGLLYSYLTPWLADNVYESGDWTTPFYKDVKDDISNESMDSLPSVPIGDRLTLALPAEEFFRQDDMRMRGIVLHDILARVESERDLEESVRTAAAQGMLPVKDVERIRRRLEEMIMSVRDRHWFDGTYSKMTEAPIIAPGGDTYRPDRIMFSENEVLVVDYKFGNRREAVHHRQVKGYMDLLKGMGYYSVRGYLWYDKEGVEEVAG
ncbi:MAG TPA: UvrD-helicase domain-containing protein [Candidatus Coprenecus stercoravium]|uniref:DNA 3'-5' helicase n=1 Tax=Candidatus Coprenecus stercoravium TaxID=2840735 RepID=A0A9D2GR42_9BACT|nr:UvrD-helicase domain-containing protein [Candidatus Coprenecus stercoravium]